MSIWSKEIMSRDWFGEGNRSSQSGYTCMHKIVDVNLLPSFIFGIVAYNVRSFIFRNDHIPTLQLKL